MPFSFLPRMIYPHLTDVRAEDLTARGVSFLMLDFDNTIVPYTTSEPTPEMAAWLGAMQASGIGLCAVSNSRKRRRPDLYGRARRQLRRGAVHPDLGHS